MNTKLISFEEAQKVISGCKPQELGEHLYLVNEYLRSNWLDVITFNTSWGQVTISLEGTKLSVVFESL